MNTIFDLLEIAASCIYAAWLRKHKDLEPKMTFLEVIFGTSYTLLFSVLRGLVYGGSWWDQSKRFARDLSIASIPIIAGEIEQWIEANEKRTDFRQEHTNGVAPPRIEEYRN